ncbi:VCBS domain-containing protein [Bradyrhizobium sediminis]|uniref:VCBS domain-containing protein n=1 Tax=Bradyrhizobium sediminis TaxID=2840469 RepID=A0A975P269_9BRAD|nr:VCBS domain-containing protein [Bradyrhizobium sediminis]QWG25567.1 VCBS domain-containing protein [Bradyrhizobium sediminis]
MDVRPKGSIGSGGPDADAIVVPDAQLLFSGDYKRSGLDLTLSKDGHEFVVRDYFRGEHRATLASPDGANLSGKTVAALAGQVDYAQAGGTPAPDQIIGHVTKLSGSATAIRNGVSITLNIGDNVHKGDVVESGADSSLGITFIDGTVFGLSSNARMVLNEMIYNPTGSNNSSLLTLVQGTISFVAGATAKHGDMKVETPTATMGIRGTAVLVEIDFDIPQSGLAPPVSFRVLVEPNGVTGEYVLLDKLTLQPIATVNQAGTQTIVNGQGVVTFIASAQIPGEAQRLINEIFALKFTDANPKNIGIPPLDSITPETFVVKLTDGTPISLTMILVNVAGLGPVAPPPPNGGNNRFHLNIPPELVAFGNSFTERSGTTGNTTLDTVSGIIRFADINPEDLPTITASFDSFVYRNAQQAIVTSSLTAEQLAAIAAVDVPLSVIPDDNNTNIGFATWTYSVPDHALDFLAAGEQLTLTYMARVDTNYSEYNTVVVKPFTITITGTNDLPTVSATGSAIIELLGTNNPVTDHAGGVITFADVDLTDRPTVTAPFAGYVYTAANGSPLTLTPAQEAAIEVALTLTPATTNTHDGSVAWSYDVLDSNFDFIAAGETLILTYMAIVDDHHGGIVTIPLTLTIAVAGTNDIPTITATSDGFVELLGTNNATPDHAGGTIVFTDVDLTDRPAISAPFSGYNYTAANGTTALTLTPLQQSALAPALTLTPSPANANNGSITWSYDLADNQFDFLAVGETLVLTYTATVNDGHGGIVSTPITVTITGTNDVPTITAAGDAIIELAGTNNAISDHAGGTITFADVDLTDQPTISALFSGYTYTAANGTTALTLTPAQQSALEIALTLTPSPTNANNGSVIWSYDLADNNFDFLAAGETLVLTYTATVNDGHGGIVTAPVTVTIHGTNDAPTITATNDSFTELAGTNNAALDHAGGTITFADVDLTDLPAVTAPFSSYSYTASNGTTALTLTPAQQSALAITLTLTPSPTNAHDGSVTWSYDLADSNFDFLAAGETLVLTYTATIDDGHGGIVTLPVTVTIHGANDVPTIAGVSAGDVTEDLAVDGTNHINATGQLTIADADTGQSNFTTQASTIGSNGYGSFALAANGTWTYTADNTQAAIQQLGVNDTLTDSFTAVSSDGTASQLVTVTIHGSNDAVAINSIAPQNLTEQTDTNPLSAAIPVTFTDVDLQDGHTAQITHVSASGVTGGFAALDDAALIALMTTGAVVEPTGSSPGSLSLNFAADSPVFDYLEDTEVVTLAYTLEIDDLHGGVTTQTSYVHITGVTDLLI